MAKAGRPSAYKKKYCQGIIDHMSEGPSAVSYAAEIGVCRDTLYEWKDKHPEFKKAFGIAMARCQQFWETTGIQNLVTQGQHTKFNAGVWIFWMKARFGWKDYQEVSLSTEEDGLTINFNGRNPNEGS